MRLPRDHCWELEDECQKVDLDHTLAPNQHVFEAAHEIFMRRGSLGDLGKLISPNTANPI